MQTFYIQFLGHFGFFVFKCRFVTICMLEFELPPFVCKHKPISPIQIDETGWYSIYSQDYVNLGVMWCETCSVNTENMDWIRDPCSKTIQRNSVAYSALFRTNERWRSCCFVPRQYCRKSHAVFLKKKVFVQKAASSTKERVQYYVIEVWITFTFKKAKESISSLKWEYTTAQSSYDFL